MNDGKEFTDIVGAKAKLFVEELAFGAGIDALVFHHPRIAGAGGVYADTVPDDLTAGFFRNNRLRLALARAAGADVVAEATAVSLNGLFPGRESLVFGAGVPLDLQLTVRPVILNARVVTFPDDVEFFLFGHIEQL